MWNDVKFALGLHHTTECYAFYVNYAKFIFPEMKMKMKTQWWMHDDDDEKSKMQRLMNEASFIKKKKHSYTHAHITTCQCIWHCDFKLMMIILLQY